MLIGYILARVCIKFWCSSFLYGAICVQLTDRGFDDWEYVSELHFSIIIEPEVSTFLNTCTVLFFRGCVSEVAVPSHPIRRYISIPRKLCFRFDGYRVQMIRYILALEWYSFVGTLQQPIISLVHRCLKALNVKYLSDMFCRICVLVRLIHHITVTS